MNVDPGIFKAYDIRGIVPAQLNPEAAYYIGRAFASFIGGPRVVVGRDMRLSGPAIFDAVTRGLMDQGMDVCNIGMVSTDQYYFACATLDLPGMMVTASHNPAEYNGFKMVRRIPYLLSGEEGIQDLRRLVETEAFPAPERQGAMESIDLTEEFVQKILSIIDVSAIMNLHVIADTGNGMVGPVLDEIYRRLPIRYVSLYPEPDGSLPNHGLDPLQPENRRDLEARVLAEGADVGFAFDGDGDRFFAIDDRADFVPGDFLTALMGVYFLEKHPGAKILYDVRSSWAVPNLIREAGGVPLIERVGHAFIKKRMSDEEIVFGGEVTGHYYFQDFFYADSGILPSLVLLEMLSKSGKKLSELLQPLEEKYFLTGEVNSRVPDPAAKVQELAERYKDGKIEWLDGISVTYDDWHFNVRPSNTEPLLRLNLEALTREKMEAKRDEVLRIIRG
ncbi:MAG: phosphomannomutase/phosphoglucomutase [Armatimonadetes bacterium]|nr:phosphomannomutase/phosphoglucomutase [Armatimonadota bacterium]